MESRQWFHVLEVHFFLKGNLKVTNDNINKKLYFLGSLGFCHYLYCKSDNGNNVVLWKSNGIDNYIFCTLLYLLTMENLGQVGILGYTDKEC